MRLSLGSRVSRLTLVLLTTNAIVLVGAAPTARAAPAEDDSGWVGACLLIGTADYDPSPPTVPAADQDVEIDLFGDCVTSAGLSAKGWLDADLSTTGDTDLFGCVGGVISGTGTFRSDTPDFPTTDVDVTTVNVAGALAMVISTDTDIPNGLGAGAQSPIDTVACLTGGMPSATWIVAIEFHML